MTNLNILSGGAAHGLVASLTPKFKEMTGFDIDGEFGAVGAMADKLRKNTPTDIVILTAAIVAKLAQESWVVPASIRDVGIVETAIAVRTGGSRVNVNDAASLRGAFLAADAIFLPDTKNSTAGLHMAKVLEQLGIGDAVADRLRIHPNGSTAMRQMAKSDAVRPIGCTQSTEIINTPGVMLSGPLPAGCELATMYTAAVTTRAANPEQAQSLVDLLTDFDRRELRTKAGFLDPR
jgi:molybdate transport system substrate-binding protein